MNEITCLVRVVACAAALSSIWPALAADEIVVARSLTTSGPLGSYGEAKRDGQDAYLERINREGGIRGRKFRAVTLDDGYAPDRMVQNIRKLAAEEKPVVFLGLFGVPTVAASIPVIHELKIPAVGLSSGTAILRSEYRPWLFPVRASYADEARAVVGQMVTLGLTRVTIVQRDDPFGKGARDIFAEELTRRGLTFKDLKVDLKGEQVPQVIEALKKEPPQVVFLATTAAPTVPILQGMSQDLAGVAAYSFSPVDGLVVLKQAGPAARGLGISQIVPSPTSDVVELSREYRKDAKALGRTPPSYYGLEGYLETMVFVEGVRRIKGPITPAALAKALETMNPYLAGGVEIFYSDKAHKGADFVELTVIGAKGVQR